MSSPSYPLSSPEFHRLMFWAQRSPELAVDTEGDPAIHQTMGISLGGVTPTGQEFCDYVPLNHKSGNVPAPADWIPHLKWVLENHPCLIFHNAKYDIKALKWFGIDIPDRWWDTMLMAHWINENWLSKGLDYLGKIALGDEGKKKDPVFKAWLKVFDWGGIHPNIMRSYAAHDALLTYRLFRHLKPEFETQGFNDSSNPTGNLWEFERRFCRLVLQMEERGILIDQSICEREIKRGDTRMAEIVETLGKNPASRIELEELLVKDLGLPVLKKSEKTGDPSFAKEVMRRYEEMLAVKNDPKASLVLEFRGWQKTVSSNYRPYLALLASDGRLHPNFKLHGTRTSRLSCELPNLQQIPRVSDYDWNGNLKAAFVPTPGFSLVECDFSNLELRLAAAYAKEPTLIEAFEAGRDVFSEMARDLGFPDPTGKGRQRTKVLVYLSSYGGGARKLSESLSLPFAEAQSILSHFFLTFPRLKKMSLMVQRRCEMRGFVKLWTGRRRHFDNPREEAHKAWNAVIQGGGAEIVKRSMLRLVEEGLDNPDCRILLTVHDSIICEIREGLVGCFSPQIQAIMEDVRPSFGVRFAVKVKEWGQE